MTLRYKISLLTTATVIIVLIPFSFIHIRALAQQDDNIALVIVKKM